MKYTKGDRVRHPAKTDWGLGEVLENSNGNNVRIFFVGAGEKTLSLKHVQPEHVAPSESHHPVLDNLKISPSSSGVKYQSLPQSIHFFLEQFPEGFYGQKFIETERGYKLQAHKLGLELLNEPLFRSLLQNKDFADICRRALKLVNATNLIFPNEKMALKDALAIDNARELFANALYELLYGHDELKGRFTRLTTALEEIGADKWTTASYFPFIIQPDQHMFVKPQITQHASELCGYEINYRPQLNWITYKSVQDFARYLHTALAELKPRDMIDVQSFMWCIAPGKY